MRFRKAFEAQYFAPGQIILMELQSAVIICTVKKTQLIDIGLNTTNSMKDVLGKLIDETVIEFKCTPSENFTIKGQVSTAVQSIFKSDFKFEDMGVGGLDKEIYDLFRSAFASRRLSPSLLAKYGRTHVRGLLLYGPPGTGKTLIARQLAKVLRAKEPKIVNGPELLDKYVGETERKIRLLFADAVKDEAQYGPNSPLHIIIFDEFDAICKKRGTVNSGTGVNDTAVNMILSMIDGVNALNNILVIGMTNRKDVLDEAILRPGRLEVHIEVGLPDEKGRVQILEIHTRKMKDNQLLADDVSLEKLAKISKNFTGAELEAIVKNASSRAITRTNNIFDCSKEAKITEESKVNFDDFLGALEDVKPMFGADTSKFEVLSRNNLVNYGPRFMSNQEIIMELIEKLKSSQNSQLMSVLLTGQKGTGKSALASWAALKSDFPFVKLISADHFVEFTEVGKVETMVKVFEDAYKCPLSLVVIDDIERIIEYTNIGPRFSNHLLQAILVLTKKVPKKANHKIMIIGTTSQASVLKDLEVVQGFDIIVDLPMLDQTEEIMKVLSMFPGEESEKEKIAKSLRSISIKKLMMLADVALDGKNELVYDKFAKAYARSGSGAALGSGLL